MLFCGFPFSFFFFLNLLSYFSFFISLLLLRKLAYFSFFISLLLLRKLADRLGKVVLANEVWGVDVAERALELEIRW